jgi:hypothetical protein
MRKLKIDALLGMFLFFAVAGAFLSAKTGNFQYHETLGTLAVILMLIHVGNRFRIIKNYPKLFLKKKSAQEKAPE